LLDEPSEGAAGDARVSVQGLLAIRGRVGVDLEDVGGSTASKGDLLVDAADGINRSVDGQGLAKGESNGREEDDGESHVENGKDNDNAWTLAARGGCYGCYCC
jgi:hypothetical protein